MTTTPQALAPGSLLPPLSGVDPSGADVSALAWSGTQGSVVYFMRTATCPVCHGHLKHLSGLVHAAGERGISIVVVAPGGAGEAAAVASRHPALAGTVMASEDAHRDVGLFVKAGLQQSGTVVLDASHTVIHATVATVPTGSMDRAALTAFLEATPPQP